MTPRVAIVAHAHPSISKGGAEIAAYSAYMGLRAIGEDPIFVAICPKSRMADVELDTDREYVVGFDSQYYDYFYHLGMPDNIQRLSEILTHNAIEIINFHHFLHWGINALKHVKNTSTARLYFTLHEYLGICANHGQMVTHPNGSLCAGATPSACAACIPGSSISAMRRRASMFRDNFASVDGFISPSKFLRQRYVEWGLESSRIRVIENGLTHRSLGVAQRPHTSGKKVVFGYFGQINPFKGIDLLLDAANQLWTANPNAPVEIRIHGNLVGQSGEFLELFHHSVQNNSLLTYLGEYRNTEALNLMAGCDAIVVPSKWWENSPVVIQEAYAARVPVICANVGGLAEKVRHNITGLHFEFKDPNSLATVMSQFAAMKLGGGAMNIFPPVPSSVDMARAYLEFFTAKSLAT